MNIAIAIFAKNPNLSPVKTRLAADIGKEGATKVYQKLLILTENVVSNFVAQSEYNITPYWALAEKESCTLPEWQNFQTFWTGEGELGERLHHVYSTLIKKYDAVILIGSDCPEIDSEALNNAAQLVTETDKVIIGPSEDGGFYLFGFTGEVKESIWLETPYSCMQTRQKLRENLEKESLHVSSISSKRDLDDINDLNYFTFLN